MNRKVTIVILVAVVTVSAMLIFSLVKGGSNTDTSAKSQTTNIATTSPSKYNGITVRSVEHRSDNKRFLLRVSWPVTQNSEINSQLDELSNNFISEYESESRKQRKLANEYEKRTGSKPVSTGVVFNQHFDVSFANDDYISFVFDRYRNSGNTGSDTSFSVIFDRHSGERIPIGDLFAGDDYLSRLSEISRQKLTIQLKKRVQQMDIDTDEESRRLVESGKELIRQGTEPTEDNFDSVTVTASSTLKITFDKYQAGPGSAGVQTVEIPLKMLADILAPEVRELFNIEQVDKTEREPEPKAPAADDAKPDIDYTPPETAKNVDCDQKKCIALTFDDGPSEYTSQLLHILDRKNVLATFFILGRSAKIQQDTVAQIAKEGHEIGNHTWNHRDLRKLSDAGIKKEILKNRRFITDITGQPPQFFRPPYGALNDKARSLIDVPIILWNIDPEDWKIRDTKKVSDHIVSHAKDGAIVLSHDIYSTTVEAIPTVIDRLRDQGYHLVTISELLGGKLAPGVVFRHR